MPKTAKIIFAIAILFFVISGLVIFSVINKKSLPFVSGPTPSPLPNIAKPAAVTTVQVKGTVASASANLLGLRVNNKVTSYNISRTQDIQGIVSGSPEKGDVVTVQTTKSELRSNQEVILLIEKGTNIVKSIYIFKKL